MDNTNIETLKAVLAMVEETATGSRPRAVLACVGASDEHWQIYTSHSTQWPYVTIVNGVIERHPDHPGL